ncbi:hypothetical protein GCM10008094_30910 [Aidingimonas halophila]|nr:hypothetical protein GCM10008094_30910 [Aidingimonas halophila]
MESYRYKVSAIYLIARFSKGQYKRSSLKYMSLLEEFDILGRLLSEKDYLFFKENMCLEQNCLNWNLSLDIDPDKKIRVLGPLVTNYKEEDGYDSIIIKPERFYLDSNSRAFAYYNTEDFLFKLKDIIDLIESGAIKKVMTTNKDEYSKYWVTPAIPLPYDFIFSNPLALITIINTLLYHGYGEILLEGFNFYTGGPVYSDKYHSSVKTGTGSLNKEKFLESLCGHDLLLNYIILKSMTEYKVLYVDHHLKYIHETTPYEYIKKFEDGLYE